MATAWTSSTTMERATSQTQSKQNKLTMSMQEALYVSCSCDARRAIKLRSACTQDAAVEPRDVWRLDPHAVMITVSMTRVAQTQLAVPILKLFRVPSPVPPTYCSQYAHHSRVRSVTCTLPAGSLAFSALHSASESVAPRPVAFGLRDFCTGDPPTASSAVCYYCQAEIATQ